jgi:2-polyprenyl-6-methoxyphenol hydroxylase-like FAD-dependent oxidoreductase
MTTRGSILISGAGVCGPTLAYWLRKYGWETTVLERAAALRTAGQNVDVRGAGRLVARRMGIEDQIRQAGTGEVGTRFVDGRGRAIAEFPAGTGDSDGATAELEILRGQLVRLLVELTEDGVEYLYGDHIEGVRQDDAGVTVTGAYVLADPISRLGLLAFHTALRLAASPPGRGLASRLFTPPADELDLPDYTRHVG